MKPLPKITVVTPSYNQAAYIGWTVRSVLLQRYPNLEYILMDGGSTDGTQTVLEPYRQHFAHYQSAKDKGQSEAVYNGFARSSGEIMCYLNSDDMLAPGALQYVARYFEEHPEVDAIYSHRCTVDAVNNAIWYWILPPHSNWYMMRWDLIPQETCFWRRRLFEKAGNIDPTFRFALDMDLFVRYMRAGKFMRVNRFLGSFRQHDGAKTSQQLATIGSQEIQRIWHTYGLDASRVPSPLKRVWWINDPCEKARIVATRLREVMFTTSVARNGSRFVQSGKQLPGSLPGIGWNYDDLWGGLLNDTRLAPVL